MMDLPGTFWMLTALGGVVGFVIAFSGAGGGVLAVPLLVFSLHLPMREAAPISLVSVGLTAALGAVLGLREGLVRYRAAALMGIAGMLMSPLGVALAQYVPNAPLLLAFSALLAFTAWRMARRAWPGAGGEDPHVGQQACQVDPDEGRLTWTRPCARALAGIGALAGFLSGLLGVGGGFVTVPALTRHTDLDPRSVLLTSQAVIALASIGGMTAAARHGSLDLGAALPFGAGALVALLLGRRLAARVDGIRLQQAFVLVAVAVAVLMAARGLGVLPV